VRNIPELVDDWRSFLTVVATTALPGVVVGLVRMWPKLLGTAGNGQRILIWMGPPVAFI
jgi:hypothetical protein